MDKIVLPKKWKELSVEDQKEWIEDFIKSHHLRIPEPVVKRKDEVEKGELKLKSGAKIKFIDTDVTISRKNPLFEREFEAWLEKWLITVFHDKRMPHIKIFGISNPSTEKWIAQELSPEILNKLYAIILKIRWKYGFFKGKKGKKRR